MSRDREVLERYKDFHDGFGEILPHFILVSRKYSKDCISVFQYFYNPAKEFFPLHEL